MGPRSRKRGEYKVHGSVTGRLPFDDPKEPAPHPMRMTDPNLVKAFIHAGNATFTIVGKQRRFTYKIKTAPLGEGEVRHSSPVVAFVKVFIGPDNTDFNSYTYLGHLYNDGTYVHGKNSKISPTADSAIAFEWFYNMLHFSNTIKPEMEFWHDGRCGRCGHKLTVPRSIRLGIGPECEQYVKASS